MTNKIRKRKLSLLARRKINKENRSRKTELKNRMHIEDTEIPTTSFFTPLTSVDVNAVPDLRNSDEIPVTDNSNTEMISLALETASIENDNCDLTEPFKIEIENSDDFQPIQGRRIIDINYFLLQLQEKANHNQLFDCKVAYFKLVGEKRIGLLSKFKFVCSVCQEEVVISSEKIDDTENVNANIAATTGIVSAGIGYSQFEEIFSALNIPIFSPKFYSSVQDQVYETWEKIAVQSLEAAAKREKEAAISGGRIVNDIPTIDVYVDGCWSARSYGNNFKALSGAAVIIGKRFGEVLYLGVKNKYCLICARANKQGVIPKQHKCYKNYNGSSSSMESEIILEGFKSSLEMYGLAYSRVIADGDASTYNKILKEDPYKSLGIVVEKIECRNHILRNFCKKLRAVVKDTKYPLKHRKTLKDSRIMMMRKYVVKSILHYNQITDKPRRIRETLLYNDIQNSVAHAFGEHRLCNNYNCTLNRNEKNELGFIQNTNFLFRINAIVATTAVKSRSLIENVDTNTVERFNSVIAKLVGGKRINFSQRRGYQARCSAAVVSFNDESIVSSVQKMILGKSPKGKVMEMEKRRALKRKLNMEHPVRKMRKNRECKKIQYDYGPNSATPDMTLEQMKQAKQSFLENLNTLVADRDCIERCTVLQRNSSEWLEIRKKIITASNFGPICKRKLAKDTSPLVKNILYKKNLTHVMSVAHGIENENQALQQMQEQESITIKPCGLFIDRNYAFIGASPDGLVGDNIIVEVKCPVSAHKEGLRTAIETNKISILHYNKNTKKITLKKTSNWFFQVQGQLHVTKRKICLLGIWAGPNESMHVEHIVRDDEFWEMKMLPKILSFYMNCLLPEIVNPRHTRGMEIRKTTLVEQPILSTNEPSARLEEEVALPNTELSKPYVEETVLSTIAIHEPTEIPLEDISRIYNFQEF